MHRHHERDPPATHYDTLTLFEMKAGDTDEETKAREAVGLPIGAGIYVWRNGK